MSRLPDGRTKSSGESVGTTNSRVVHSPEETVVERVYKREDGRGVEERSAQMYDRTSIPRVSTPNRKVAISLTSEH